MPFITHKPYKPQKAIVKEHYMKQAKYESSAYKQEEERQNTTTETIEQTNVCSIFNLVITVLRFQLP